MKSARSVLLAAIPSLALAAPALAGGELSFRLDKVYDDCEAVNTDHATYMNCIYTDVGKITAKMQDNVLAAAQTYLVKLPCQDDGKTCGGLGYKVTYGDNDAGHTITILFPTGKVAHYSRCGTCSQPEPDSDSEIELRLLETKGAVILEFPSSEYQE